MKLSIDGLDDKIAGGAGFKVRNSGNIKKSIAGSILFAVTLVAGSASAYDGEKLPKLDSKQCQQIHRISEVACFPAVITDVKQVEDAADFGGGSGKKPKSTATGRMLGQLAGVLVGEQMRGTQLRSISYPTQTVVRKTVDDTVSSKLGSRRSKEDLSANLYDITLTVKDPSGQYVDVVVRQSGAIKDVLNVGADASLLYVERPGKSPRLTAVNSNKDFDAQVELIEESKTDNFSKNKTFVPVTRSSF